MIPAHVKAIGDFPAAHGSAATTEATIAANGPRVYELAVRAQAVAQATDVTELQVEAQGATANRSRKPAVRRCAQPSKKPQGTNPPPLLA